MIHEHWKIIFTKNSNRKILTVIISISKKITVIFMIHIRIIISSNTYNLIIWILWLWSLKKIIHIKYNKNFIEIWCISKTGFTKLDWIKIMTTLVFRWFSSIFSYYINRNTIKTPSKMKRSNSKLLKSMKMK